MKTVRLHSRVGPVHLRRRVVDNGVYRIENHDWDFENGFNHEVPVDYWEELAPQFLDRVTGLKYSEALIPI